MLNPFPGLLNFAFDAPTIIRVVAAIAFIYCAFVHFNSRRELRALFTPLVSSPLALPLAVIYALIELGAGVLLLVGLYTQPAAIVGMLLALKYGVMKPKLLSPLSHAADWLLFFMCASLLLSGAGNIAFDIPL